jgi:hypothetical protein
MKCVLLVSTVLVTNILYFIMEVYSTLVLELVKRSLGEEA